MPCQRASGFWGAVLCVCVCVVCVCVVCVLCVMTSSSHYVLIIIIQQLRVMGLKTRSASAFMSKNMEHTCSRITKTNKQTKNTKVHIVTSLKFGDD